MKKIFHVEVPHTKEECIKAMDETLALGKDVLSSYKWGCAVGEHTSWAMIEADSQEGAKNMVPPSMSHKAKITEVSDLSPRQIKDYHSSM